ncbi:MAG TPA: phosphatase PAP2 family protein [Thermoanaerobaculia bacterium]|nr:phosphatase PAP2 family protein [Thermoanaerobaculia bacterium]
MQSLSLIQDSEAPQARVARLFEWLDPLEAALLRRLLSRSRSGITRRLAAAVTFAGNGWLYLVLAIVVPMVAGLPGWKFVGVAGVTLVASFTIYPPLKRILARNRPCDYDSSLASPVRVLDRYSCPSGHCMTATAIAIPLALIFPSMFLPVVGAWALIGWSRLLLGHHYPSDVLAGTVLGVIIALPVSMLML